MNARIVIGGFIVAHLVSVIFYFPERIKRTRWCFSTRLVGAVVVRRLPGRVPRVPLLHEEGARSLGCPTPIRWRWVCRWAGSSGAPAASPRTTTPGAHTSFFLSVNYPDGPAPSISASTSCCSRSCMTAVLFRYDRKPRPPGRIIGARGADVRAGAVRPRLPARHRRGPPGPALRGLTPAQWACLATAGSASTCGAAASLPRPRRQRHCRIAAARRAPAARRNV